MSSAAAPRPLTSSTRGPTPRKGGGVALPPSRASASPEMVGVPPPGADRVPTPAARSPAPPPPLPYRVSLFDAFKFAGPAPETVNGRLAMAFFPVLAAQEASTGLSARALGERLLHAASSSPDPATLALAGAAVLVVVASLAPIRVGAIAEAVGPFSPVAERVNGRLAMCAWALLLYLERAAGGVPFF